MGELADMPPPAITVPPAAPAPPPAAAPATDTSAVSKLQETLKAGWKTTEMWLTTFLFLGLGTVIEQLLKDLPDLAKSTGNPLVIAAVPIAVGLLGGALTWAKVSYTKSRTQLKLATTPPANDAAAAAALNGVKMLVVLALGAALLLPSSARACPAGQVEFGGGCIISSTKVESCPELLDAGTPELAVKAAPGSLVPSDAWLVSPARMCLVGAKVQTDEAIAASSPVGTIALSAAGGAAVAVAIVFGALAASGHLK